jgi:hypothetical protein
MLLLLLVGLLLLLRFATRQLFALLFQLPPRFTRFEPDGRRPEFFFQSRWDCCGNAQNESSPLETNSFFTEAIRPFRSSLFSSS